MRRSRSIYERALDVDPRNVTVWLKYVGMEMGLVASALPVMCLGLCLAHRGRQRLASPCPAMPYPCTPPPPPPPCSFLADVACRH